MTNNKDKTRTVAINFGLPREAVRSERPSCDGGRAGRAGVMETYVGGHALGRLCKGIMTGGLCGEGEFAHSVYRR